MQKFSFTPGPGKLPKVYLFIFTAEFWAGVVAFHGLENHYRWTVLRLAF